jgi:hypothetical protein
MKLNSLIETNDKYVYVNFKQSIKLLNKIRASTKERNPSRSITQGISAMHPTQDSFLNVSHDTNHPKLSSRSKSKSMKLVQPEGSARVKKGKGVGFAKQ